MFTPEVATLRDDLAAVFSTHQPIEDDCDEGGLVCSNPHHLADAVLPLIEAARKQAAAEALTDLRSRLSKASATLQHVPSGTPEAEEARLFSKAQGVRLAASYVDDAIRTSP